MTKEQRDRAVLKGLLAVAAAVAFVFLGIRPRMARIDALEREVGEMRDRIFSADRLLRREPKIRADAERLRAQLRTRFDEHLPSTANTLLWAARTVAAVAGPAGIDDPSVAEQSRATPAWVRDPSPRPGAARQRQPERRFAPFAVQMQFRASLPRTLLFIAALQDEYPLLNVGALSIHGDARDPEMQRVSMTLEWPIHVGPIDPMVEALLDAPAADQADHAEAMPDEPGETEEHAP